MTIKVSYKGIDFEFADIPTLEHLRRILVHQLPEYMLPLDVHLVNEFPLTHHSKIDYATLAASVVSLEGHSYDSALKSGAWPVRRRSVPATWCRDPCCARHCYAWSAKNTCCC